MVWISLFLMLMLLDKSLSIQDCSQDSVSVLAFKHFEKKEIRCVVRNGPQDLCDVGFLWPGYISCVRPESKLPSQWSGRSLADDYALGCWRCESDRSWVQQSAMRCRGNETACDTSVNSDCFAEFDPTMTIAYLLLLVAACVGIFGCLCCIGVCGYLTHCMLSQSRAPRYVYSSSSSFP